MAEEWAKLHTSILGDPKLMRAARKGAKGLEMLPWLIAFAKPDGRDGYLIVGQEPAEPEDIAELIPGKPVRAVAACIQSCLEIGTLSRDDAFLYFTNWERRNVVRPSDTPSAVTERVRRHREKKRAERNGETLGETSETSFQGDRVTASNALEIDVDGEVERDGDIERDEKHSSPDGDEREPGKALALTGSQVVAKRTAEAIIARIGEVWAGLEAGEDESRRVTYYRTKRAELVFAYWATRMHHKDAIFDKKRENRLIRALKENGDNVHELLYAIDGARADDWIMGRDPKSPKKYDGIEVIFRDRAQIERLSGETPGWRAKRMHPLAEKHAEAMGIVLDGHVPLDEEEPPDAAAAVQ